VWAPPSTTSRSSKPLGLSSPSSSGIHPRHLAVVGFFCCKHAADDEDVDADTDDDGKGAARITLGGDGDSFLKGA
jgi:hypothetical protein